MLSDLWLMSAATFRRSGKIEQARGAIQEAEVRDDENPGVWVQVRCHIFPDTLLYRCMSSLTTISYVSARTLPHGPQPPPTRHPSLPKSPLHLTRPHPRHDSPLSSLPRTLHSLWFRAQHPPCSQTGQHRPRGRFTFRPDERSGLGLCGGVVLFGEGKWAERDEGEGEGVFELCVGVGGGEAVEGFGGCGRVVFVMLWWW